MDRICLVSGGDSNYYPMLLEWIHSVRRFPQSENMDIAIFDAGMTRDQCQQLEEMGCVVKEAQWPCKLPSWKIRGREYMRACVARPFIPEYFPGYDIYFWMDADVWIQDWSGMEMFIEAARRGAIALTSQVDRCYPRQIRIKWLGRIPYKVRSFYFSNARKAFGFKTAKDMLNHHVLLAGGFAMRGDAPHWKVWQNLILKALKKGKIFTAEQLTLGMMVHKEKMPVQILPAYTHWLFCHKPLWDKERKVFVEPFMPHEVIGLLHMAGFDDGRIDRSVKLDFTCTDGSVQNMNFRYPYYDGEKQQEINQ
jgi:hypothetical protein